MTRRKLAALWITLQVLALAGWALVEASRRGTGEAILVRTVPVDPRDLLRGQYLELAYPFSRPWTGLGGELEDGADVWIWMREEDGLHEPLFELPQPPQRTAPGDVVLRGRVEGARYVFGIERFFVPEGSATPDPEAVRVRLRVHQGVPRIEAVYVDGERWP